MEQLSEIISIIGGGINSIVLPLITALLFYDAKRRREDAAATKAEADNLTQYAAEWKRFYEEGRDEAKELNAKIDQLYREKEDDRRRIRELLERNTRLSLDVQALEFVRCNIALRCANRQPPNDYIRRTVDGIDPKEKKGEEDGKDNR